MANSNNLSSIFIQKSLNLQHLLQLLIIILPFIKKLVLQTPRQSAEIEESRSLLADVEKAFMEDKQLRREEGAAQFQDIRSLLEATAKDLLEARCLREEEHKKMEVKQVNATK